MIIAIWNSIYWWIAMYWASGGELVTAAQVWAGQGVIVLIQLGQMGMKWRSDRMQFDREQRQRDWDLYDRAEARKASEQRSEAIKEKVEETKKEVVETHRKLDNGLQTSVDSVLKRFDDLPGPVSDAVAAKVAETAAEAVASKVVEKLKTNGS